MKKRFKEIYEHLTDKQKDLFYEYLADLYPSVLSGFVKIANLKAKKRWYFFDASMLAQPEYFEDEVFAKNRFSSNNLFLSMNGFISPTNARQQNLLYINAFAIDIDYKAVPRFKKMEPLEIWEHLKSFCTEYLPYPTWLEWSNQLRLIYVLDIPMRLTKKSRKKQIALVKKIKETIELSIANHPWGQFGIDVGGNPVQSYVRMPFSINVKKNVEYYDVRVKKIGSKVNLEYLQKTYLPELGEWYDADYQEHKEKKAKTKFSNINDVQNKRIQTYRMFQDYLNHHESQGHREILCHLFFNAFFGVCDSIEETMDATLAFNQGFTCPLPEHRLKVSVKSSERYWYKNSSIMQKLDITNALAEELNLPIIEEKSRKDINHDYYVRHKDKFKKTKNQNNSKKTRVKQRQDKIMQLLKEGLTKDEILSMLNIGKSTFHRDLDALRSTRNCPIFD